MAVAKVSEIKASSSKSFEDAAQQGINRSVKTLRNIKSAWIKDFEVKVNEEGKIYEYRVLMKVTFILEEK